MRLFRQEKKIFHGQDSNPDHLDAGPKHVWTTNQLSNKLGTGKFEVCLTGLPSLSPFDPSQKWKNLKRSISQFKNGSCEFFWWKKNWKDLVSQKIVASAWNRFFEWSLEHEARLVGLLVHPEDPPEVHFSSELRWDSSRQLFVESDLKVVQA